MNDERCRVWPGFLTEADSLASELDRDGRHLYRAGERYEITRDGQTIAAGLTLAEVRRQAERLAELVAEHQTQWERQVQWEPEAG